ncbi:hypothetical protein BASA62_007798 [Batrachochytrium salamandrivorans]|nr:hypothetical protein BASA62_007798 [Batrachochytrium salamandrivorans]
MRAPTTSSSSSAEVASLRSPPSWSSRLEPPSSRTTAVGHVTPSPAVAAVPSDSAMVVDAAAAASHIPAVAAYNRRSSLQLTVPSGLASSHPWQMDSATSPAEQTPTSATPIYSAHSTLVGSESTITAPATTSNAVAAAAAASAVVISPSLSSKPVPKKTPARSRKPRASAAAKSKPYNTPAQQEDSTTSTAQKQKQQQQQRSLKEEGKQDVEEASVFEMASGSGSGLCQPSRTHLPSRNYSHSHTKSQKSIESSSSNDKADLAVSNASKLQQQSSIGTTPTPTPTPTTTAIDCLPNNTQPPPTSISVSAKRKQAKRDLLTEDEKRFNHIVSEQKRRNFIRIGFQTLVDLTPFLANTPPAPSGPGNTGGCHSKSAILFKSADYIRTLQTQVDALKAEVARQGALLGNVPDINAILARASDAAAARSLASNTPNGVDEHC